MEIIVDIFGGDSRMKFTNKLMQYFKEQYANIQHIKQKNKPIY